MLLLLAALALTQSDTTMQAVAIPRSDDSTVTIDGRLDEAAWANASALRGFSQYIPNDNRPAEDSTVVLVWYSSGSIYFGIRAWQDSGSVRATLADRDNIGGDDYVQLVLDPLGDRRQAIVFGVNPLGVQSDGTLRDAPRRSIDATNSSLSGAYTVDLNPDFVYASKGRLTSWGYEIEIRIPFKSLRYQAHDPQSWGLNVIRVVQATGHQHTWTRVLQTRTSFLAQSGTLTGLSDLHRGLVLDATPEATSTASGSRQSTGWRYAGGDPRIGATIRWGMTSTLSLAGTVRPDFSQVEADVPQIQFDPRFALFFPEKRPFFLDGLDLFSTPVQLIYTRRLGDPTAAIKLVGQLGATTVATLSGVDGTVASAGGDHPLLNAMRLRRNIGGQNILGMVYTDRVDGARFNRVAAVDERLLLGAGHAWDLTVQSGASATRDSARSPVRWAPMWKAVLIRSGRRFGLNVQSYGVHGDFQASSGFVARSGFISTSVIPNIMLSGPPGSLIESFNANVYLADRINDWGRPTASASRDDRQADFSFGFTLRGGWQLGTGISVEEFGYPASLFSNYSIERRAGVGVVDTVPFTGQPHIANLDFGANIATPRFQNFSLTAFVLAGHDEDFFEWASARIILSTIDLAWRPTDRLRTELIYDHQQVNRRTDGSLVSLTRVPRLKVEYQLARAVFLRVVGQYTSNQLDSLRDDSRTNDPILLRDPVTGKFTRSAASASNAFRVDWLFSYRPVPGTVFFAGYGSTFADPNAFRFRELSRTTDLFFVKLSFLFRA
jgi:Domain of unknown function (DUF5916)